jgi:hypothetical protein
MHTTRNGRRSWRTRPYNPAHYCERRAESAFAICQPNYRRIPSRRSRGGSIDVWNGYGNEGNSSLRIGPLIAYGLFLVLSGTLLFAGVQPNVMGIEGSATSYPRGSWGLGVVVPEGAQVEGGGFVSWRNTSEIGALMRLPNITHTDNTILSVLSAMAADGSVLQVAAGLYPNMSNWLAYGWFIQSAKANPESYAWILNSSKPEMAPGAWVSLSISISSNRWRYSVEDISTHEAVGGEFMFNVTPSFMTGDQELFGLESYSYSNRVFENMGSLVLSSLLVNGMRVTNGWYYYADWDTSHNPLFVVGGLNPPPFISTNELGNGTITWTYSQWTGSGEAVRISTSVLVAFAAIPAIVAVTVLVVILAPRKRRS